jgi:hypothetical protein
VRVNDFSQIAGMKKLSSLSVSNEGGGTTSNFDLSVVQSLTKLGLLAIVNYQITTLEPLRPLTGLMNLILEKNGITDIGVVANMPDLAFVRLNFNPIKSLKPLENLEKINQLNLNLTIDRSNPELCPTQSKNVRLNEYCLGLH